MAKADRKRKIKQKRADNGKLSTSQRNRNRAKAGKASRMSRKAPTLNGYERLRTTNTEHVQLKQRIDAAFKRNGLDPAKYCKQKRWRGSVDLIAASLFALSISGMGNPEMSRLFGRDVSVIARMVREHQAIRNKMREDALFNIRHQGVLSKDDCDQLQRYVDARQTALGLLQAPTWKVKTQGSRELTDEEVRAAVNRYMELFTMVDRVAVQWTRQMVRLCENMGGLDLHQLKQIAELIGNPKAEDSILRKVA